MSPNVNVYIERHQTHTFARCTLLTDLSQIIAIALDEISTLVAVPFFDEKHLQVM